MALTAEQIKARDGKLTASRVKCLMDGDGAEIYNLWLEMTGDPSFVAPNFDGVWHIALGEATEQVNLDWFARKHGPVSGRGKVFSNPDLTWMAATLDGWSEQHACPIETKNVGGWEPNETIIQRYMPQMHWQMLVTDTEQCALSVIIGGKEPVVWFIPRDKAYAAELMRRAVNFMENVRTLTPPVNMPAVDAPKLPAEKTYDMTQWDDVVRRDMWENTAAIWLANKKANETFDKAAKALKDKGVMPEDAARAFGFGIEITRNKAGSLSIKEFAGDGKKRKRK